MRVWDALRHLEPARPVYVEAESKKVGNVTVPEALIAELQRVCATADGALDLPEPLVPGSRVRILEGPFAGYEAELLSQDGAHRARVLLEMLGQYHAVQMPVDLLTPVR